MHITTKDYADSLYRIEQTGIVVMHDISGFSAYDTDFVCPYLTLLINEGGYARALYDMRESTHGLHDIACIMPGHILHPIESSEDYRTTIVVVSHKLFRELQFHTFSHDYDKFNITPICPLTKQQAEHMLAITEQLEAAAKYDKADLPNRENMLLSILAIGYEYLNLFRRDQDRRTCSGRHAGFLNKFCNLVVAHYQESHEVKYYADLLNLTPKYFTKVIKSATGGQSPADWIEQYIVAQAKHILKTQRLTVKETAYRVGFTESASFCRFFKRVTGLSPKEYKSGTV